MEACRRVYDKEENDNKVTGDKGTICKELTATVTREQLQAEAVKRDDDKEKNDNKGTGDKGTIREELTAANSQQPTISRQQPAVAATLGEENSSNYNC